MWFRSLIGLSLSLMISTSVQAEVFPTTPLESVTPGELCQKADSYRYPEKIAYCERDVDGHMKWNVISLYMKHISEFSINSENRKDYKIDHYVPLCMGGANEVSNLWPQHKSVYQYTDIIEEDLCKELALGNITQAQAIAQIKFAKHHLKEIQFADPIDRMKYIKDHYEQK